MESEHSELLHACDMQEEFLQSVRQEVDTEKQSLKSYRQRTGCKMNEVLVMHQSKILQFNECMQQFQIEEMQRTLHEAEWKGREQSERLKV